MKKALQSSETSVLNRVTQRNIPEDTIPLILSSPKVIISYNILGIVKFSCFYLIIFYDMSFSRCSQYWSVSNIAGFNINLDTAILAPLSMEFPCPSKNIYI
jgi:hypothetical protein